MFLILCNKYDVPKTKALVDLLDYSSEDFLVGLEYTYFGRQGDPVRHRLEKRPDAELIEQLVIPLLDKRYLLRVIRHVEIGNQRQDGSLPIGVPHRLDG